MVDGRATRCPSRASTRSSGRSSTCACTRPRCDCSAPTPSSTSDAWMKGYQFALVGPDLRRHQRDPAQHRRRACARPAAEVARDALRLHRRPARLPRRRARPARPRSARRRSCAPRGTNDGRPVGAAVGRARPRWACSALLVPEAARRARPRDARPGAAARGERAAALPEPLVEHAVVAVPAARRPRPAPLDGGETGDRGRGAPRPLRRSSSTAPTSICSCGDDELRRRAGERPSTLEPSAVGRRFAPPRRVDAVRSGRRPSATAATP